MASFDCVAINPEDAVNSTFVIQRFQTAPGNPPVQTLVKTFTANNPESFIEATMHQQASEKSSGVVKFYETSPIDGRVRIRMEYCERGSLKTYLAQQKARGTWTVEELFGHFRTLLTTLSDLYKHCIAHRCIDLTNIFVTASGALKLGDFGQAKMIKPNETVKVHTVRVARAYASPDVIFDLGEEDFIDPFKLDVWSVGKVMFEMAAMKVYVNLNTFKERQLEDTVRSGLAMYECRDLEELLLSMLARNPENRLTVEDSLQRLLSIANSFVQEATPSSDGTESVDHIASVPASSSVSGVSPAAKSPKVLLQCSHCASGEPLAKLFTCEHRLCQSCLKQRVLNEVCLVCGICNQEAEIDEVCAKDNVSRQFKELILAAVQEACEMRRRTLRR